MSKRAKQEQAVRALLRDAVGSGVTPDDRDHADLIRAGLTRAQADRVVELATLAVDSHDPQQTRPRLNRVADALAERVVTDLLPADDSNRGDHDSARRIYSTASAGVAGRNDYDEHTARRRLPDDTVVPWKQDL